MSKKKKISRRNAKEIVLNVLSNAPKEFHVNLLQMLYTGAFENTIALMEAMNSETGATELLICGMQYNGKTFDAYPLAKILDPTELPKYLAPDGKGAYESAPAV